MFISTAREAANANAGTRLQASNATHTQMAANGRCGPANGRAEIDSTLGPLPAAKDCPPSGPAEPVAIRRARYSGGCPAWLRMIPQSPVPGQRPRVALTWCDAQLWCSSASSTSSWSGCPAGWCSWCEMTPPRTQRSSCSDTRWQSRGGKSPARKPDWADRAVIAALARLPLSLCRARTRMASLN